MSDYGLVLCLNNESSHYLVATVPTLDEPSDSNSNMAEVTDIEDLIKVIHNQVFDHIAAKLVDSFDYSGTHIHGDGASCYAMALSCMIITAVRFSKSLEGN
jgi:hypothetical protein